MRPIDGVATLLQAQNAQELLNSAQREAAIAQLRHEAGTDKARDIYQTTVTKHEEASGKTIRDDDPREERRPRQEAEVDEPGTEEQETPPAHIDIVI